MYCSNNSFAFFNIYCGEDVTSPSPSNDNLTSTLSADYEETVATVAPNVQTVSGSLAEKKICFKFRIHRLTDDGRADYVDGKCCSGVELNDFKDQTLQVTVIENDGRKIVVSRRKAMEKQQRKDKLEEFKNYKVGDKISAKVVKLAEFGAFVSLGFNQGLIHKSQISHHRRSRYTYIKIRRYITFFYFCYKFFISNYLSSSFL